MTIGVGLLLAAATAVAAEPASHRCAGEPDPQQRLACYDAAFPPVAPAPPAAEVVAERSRQEFGLNQRQLEARDPELASRAPAQADRIEATLRAVEAGGDGTRVFTLDNGQVWQQTEVSSRGRVQPGERVVVRRAALGTFMLVTPSKVALRVRRLR